jgi:staphylococcal nuclease domain-containing protein 1
MRFRYRVQLQEALQGRKWRVFYVDFGTSEVRDERDLRALVGGVASVPPQAIRCRLALLKVPALVQDCGVEAADTLKELCFGKVLMASIEWRDGEEHFVTLGDAKTGININKEMVRLGVATVKSRFGKRFEKPLQQLYQAQDEARSLRLSLWRYGDILDASDEE